MRNQHRKTANSAGKAWNGYLFEAAAMLYFAFLDLSGPGGDRLVRTFTQKLCPPAAGAPVLAPCSLCFLVHIINLGVSPD